MKGGEELPASALRALLPRRLDILTTSLATNGIPVTECPIWGSLRREGSMLFPRAAPAPHERRVEIEAPLSEEVAGILAPAELALVETPDRGLERADPPS